MIKIHTLPLGAYQTNTYIVHDAASASCVLIDPGYEADTILSQVQKLGLSVEAILLTHGHFDHVGAVEQIVESTGCKLWMSERDWSQFPNPVIRFYYPIANCDFTEVQFCEEGEAIHAAGLAFTVMETPGHTYGSVCFICENVIFSGDTLFFRGVGRTDLPGGDWDTLSASLERLKALDGSQLVCPGHGPSTTLSAEKMLNPYLR